MDITDINWGEIKFPKGWHLKQEHEDDMGNLYDNGKLVKLYDGTEVNPPLTMSFLKSLSGAAPEGGNTLMLLERIDQMQKQLDSMKQASVDPLGIKGLAAEITKANREMDGKPVYDTHIEPEDFLEKPVMFVSYGGGYSIRDAKINNRSIQIPGGKPAIFKFQGGRINKNGPIQTYSCYCSYTESSKKRVEWLRNHPMYEKEFYENANLAMKADAFTAQAAKKISTMIDMMPQSSFVAKCQEHGIPFGSDPQTMKNMLHKKMLLDLLNTKKWERNENLVSTLEAEIFKD